MSAQKDDGRQPMETAPKDNSLVWLLVDYSDEDADHALADATQAWTIGFNSFADSGEDEWKFAGWCWSHDHFTQGRGSPVAWRPVGFDLEVVDA